VRIEKDQVRALLAGVGLFVLFGGGVLAPLRYQRAQHHARIAAAEHALGIDLKEASGLARLNAEVVELRRVVRGAQQYVPQDDELADVLRGLSEALTSHGIIEREMQTRPTLHHADYSTIPIELQFKGSYPSAHGVLRQIEQMHRLIRIDKLRVRGNQNDALAPLHVELTLSTFIARPLEAGD